MRGDITDDGVVVIYRAYTEIVGTLHASLLLSHLKFWQARSKAPGGWVWKTRDDLIDEIGMPRRQQESARKRLIELGLLTEEKRGSPPKMWYQINTSELDRQLAERGHPNRPYQLGSSSLSSGMIVPAERDDRPSSYITETTSETTSENGITPPSTPDEVPEWYSILATITVQPHRREVAISTSDLPGMIEWQTKRGFTDEQLTQTARAVAGKWPGKNKNVRRTFETWAGNDSRRTGRHSEGARSLRVAGKQSGPVFRHTASSPRGTGDD